MQKKTMVAYLINAASVFLLYALISGMINSGIISKYHANMLIPTGIYIMLAVSLNLTCGFLGQLHLGHAGFMAVGAYVSALFTRATSVENTTLAFSIALLLAGVIAAVVGVAVGLPALRLRGDYLAILTLGFGEIIKGILLNLEITGGARGLKGIPKLTQFSWVFLCLVLTIFTVRAIINSRFGRAIISIRENEIAAAASGVNTTLCKTCTFAAAAFFAGVAGALYAHYVGVLYPTSFGFNMSIEILVMVVLGGMGSITGSVIAATALQLAPELLRAFSDYRMVVYSLLLIFVMIFRPTGLMGRLEVSPAGIVSWVSAALRRITGLKAAKEGGSSG